MCKPYTSARTHIYGTHSVVAAGHGNLKVVGRGRGHQLSAFSTFSWYAFESTRHHVTTKAYAWWRPWGGGWVRKRNKASTQYNSLCSPTFNLKELGERNCLSFKDMLNIKLHIKRQVPKLRPCLDFKRNEKSVTIFWSALCQNWSPPNIYGATHHQPNAVYYTLCCSC